MGNGMRRVKGSVAVGVALVVASAAAFLLAGAQRTEPPLLLTSCAESLHELRTYHIHLEQGGRFLHALEIDHERVPKDPRLPFSTPPKPWCAVMVYR